MGARPKLAQCQHREGFGRNLKINTTWVSSVISEPGYQDPVTRPTSKLFTTAICLQPKLVSSQIPANVSCVPATPETDKSFMFIFFAEFKIKLFSSLTWFPMQIFWGLHNNSPLAPLSLNLSSHLDKISENAPSAVRPRTEIVTRAGSGQRLPVTHLKPSDNWATAEICCHTGSRFACGNPFHYVV